MELRTILYGYGKHQFEFHIIEEEAKIVRRIFEEYISGKTLLQIGNALTEEGVVYYRERTNWSKNAIRRIIENAHYAGDKTYPAIIEKAIYRKANSIRLEKGGDREKDTPEIHYLKYCTKCTQCGGRYTRRGHYSGQREAWNCVNGCKKSRYIDDKEFFSDIIGIVNRAIDEPTLLLKPHSIEAMYTPSLKVQRDERTLGDLLKKDKMTFQSAKKLYFEILSEQFDCCRLDTSGAVTDALISYISELKQIDKINPELFKVIISDITVDEDGIVAIRFANDVVIKTKEGDEKDEQHSSDKI